MVDLNVQAIPCLHRSPAKMSTSRIITQLNHTAPNQTVWLRQKEERINGHFLLQQSQMDTYLLGL